MRRDLQRRLDALERDLNAALEAELVRRDMVQVENQLDNVDLIEYIPQYLRRRVKKLLADPAHYVAIKEGVRRILIQEVLDRRLPKKIVAARKKAEAEQSARLRSILNDE
jgi:hypothetical protein